LGPAADLDEWIPSKDEQGPNGGMTVKYMRKATDEYLKNDNVLQNLRDSATKLVSLRRKRVLTERWEKYAMQTFYSCAKGDKCDTASLATRTELREHAFDHHELVAGTVMLREPCCTLNKCALRPTRFQDSADINAALTEHLTVCHEPGNAVSPDLDALDLSRHHEKRHNPRVLVSQNPEMADRLIRFVQKRYVPSTPQAQETWDQLVHHPQDRHGLNRLTMKTDTELDAELTAHLQERHGLSESK
jgi:hypothetical protein